MSRKTPKKSDKYRCDLLPFEREDVVGMQAAKQAVGWEITAFNLPDAWKHTQGEGVKIAVLDTGVDENHPDLSDNLLPGKNFIKAGTPPLDDNGHGTHVTGTIVADDNAIGMVGVAPAAKVVPVKVLDGSGAGHMKNVAKGVRWAADQGVDFICMSLGTPNKLQEVRKAIQYAAKKGCVTFCAAGNAGRTRNIFYPAAYPETMGIGAIDKDFDRADFSCTGDDLDFLAPGVRIFSTVPESWYAFQSGTSMANPFMVGVATLVLSYKKNKGLKAKLDTVDDYRKLFKKYTTSVTDEEAGNKFFEGFGIIDPRKMEQWIQSHH
jgi:subtilisin